MVDIQSATAEIRQGKKIEDRKKIEEQETTRQNIMAYSLLQVAIILAYVINIYIRLLP